MRLSHRVSAVGAALALFAATAAAQNDLAPLSDEFDSATSLPRWQRVQTVEQWNIEPLEVWDIDGARPGRMTMMPFTVTWYEDYVGPLAFQKVGGDFVITTEVTATGRDGQSVPEALFSLAGIMMRTPRDVTPVTWTPDGENYVFLSLGYGNVVPRTFQFEVKTTEAGVSTLILSPSPDSTAVLQLARLGPHVIALRREPGGPWTVHRRYPRADFPDTLQVGLVAYTDWNKVQHFAPPVHNTTVLDPPLAPPAADPRPDVPYAPDLRATFEYARYVRPELPPGLAGLDLTNAELVPDAELLAFLGGHANLPAPVAVGPPREPAGPGTLRASPNPLRGATRLSFALAEAGPVRVEIADAGGRRVRGLVAAVLAAGRHATVWDGRDDAGTPVRPGIYFAGLRTPRGAGSARIAVLR